ncbi:PD-(D/E)XK nuclease family protein [Methanococcoides burtonii]|uniref:PD-(D/E)XK nuclease superfamily protein n=1 Tax=Methanococcoides burtonii (strain DSM 6242 / NBRC 107633 / OCM 468 / ACE-M) TaxID=259564 RepID=Q12Z62_METBU|nr:PD-(D/E)XK nuclease family protein [Methanococcoides burtonii]ABE51264.1 Hypothetical protein Mbur_0257 [Methanococcoides burtonii DSM 6242]
MSIFDRLLQLNPNQIPLEDFFTEIFTFVLENEQSFFLSFLTHFKITEAIEPIATIWTQQTYKALDYHFSDSRPDICIEINNASHNELIFVESKIGSSEGYDQLKRYAEQLDQLNHFGKKKLVYITRDHENKDENKIFAGCNNEDELYFIQIRWYEIYNFLSTYYKQTDSEDILIRETLNFMEEHNMATNNCFNTIDILALTNFRKVQQMMDETIYGIVSDKFETEIGKVSQRASCLTQLRDFNRYVCVRYNQNYRFNVLLGYWIDTKNITSYPSYGICLEVSPTCEQRKEIIEFMNELAGQSDGWETVNHNSSKSWARVMKLSKIDTILGLENHIQLIQNNYIDLLNEVTSFKETYPDLPWE